MTRDRRFFGGRSRFRVPRKFCDSELGKLLLPFLSLVLVRSVFRFHMYDRDPLL